MSEKQLAESFWKSFAKGKTYKDDALIKALQALAKSEKGSPSEQLEALDMVEKQIDLLRKANKADKELMAQLKDMDTAIERQRKSTDAAAKLAAAKAEKSDADEEEESPALLTSKMIPLVRVLRKGEDRMRATLCIAGANTAVLITRKAISGSIRKIMAEYIDAKGGVKYMVGEVLFEKNALTFVMEGSASGLVKRIQKALLDQIGLRFRVRVRGEDGEEEDGENEEEASAGSQIPTPPPAPDQLQLTLTQRLLKLKPALEAALKAQHPESTKLRALSGYVSEKSAAKDFAGALKALEMMEKLLGVPTSVASAPSTAPKTSESPGVDAGKAFNERLAALMPKLKTAAADVRLKAAEAGNLAKKGDFKAAQAMLDELEDALEGKQPSATANKPEPKPEPKPDAATAKYAEYEKILSRLAPQYEKLSRAAIPPAVAELFKKVQQAWRVQEGAAENDDFDRALQELSKLDSGKVFEQLLKAMEEAKSSTPSGTDKDKPASGLVNYRKTMLRYEAAKKSVDTQIANLKSAIPAAAPEEQALADDLAQALNEQNEELWDALNNEINSLESNREQTTAKLVQTIDEFITSVMSNPLIQHVDNNPFGVSMFIQATLSKALKDMRQALPT